MSANTLKECKKPMTKEINKILRVNLLQMGAKQPKYRVTIEDMDKNEILYRVESFAGVIASMETQPEFTQELNRQGVEDIAVVARMQKLAWGHPMLSLTCLDQLKEAIRPHLGAIRDFVTQVKKENDSSEKKQTNKPNTTSGN